ncbi:MAG: methylmalonyl Co-A mutase-associated GTPase MeaB [Acidobacteriota bacterium]
MARRNPSVDELESGVLAGERAALGRAITLLESHRSEDRLRASDLLERLAPHRGLAHRIGVTGVPGVGKSTFLETLGVRLLEAGRRPAVLAIDPSSVVSGGSLLGDKTRMERLAADPRAFVRPSPSRGTLGGVASATRETAAVLEAAGFDPIFVETVGVGQSEAVVADLVDTVLLLLLPGAGDELQGIKRGLLERVDVAVIHKADGAERESARRARLEHASALRLLVGSARRAPPVLTASSLSGDGIDEVWDALAAHREELERDGELERRRRAQRRRGLWRLVEERLLERLRDDVEIAGLLTDLEDRVAAGTLPAAAAADEILSRFVSPPKGPHVDFERSGGS